MSTVWLVTKGCYSDYRLVGVFSSKENAKKYMRAFPHDGYDGYNDIEEYELDRAIIEIDAGLRNYIINMAVDGQVLNTQVNNEYDPNEGRFEIWGGKRITHYTFNIWAKDESHAVKIANERRIMALASQDAR